MRCDKIVLIGCDIFMSKEIFEKASAIIEEYNNQFSKFGLKCKVSRKYSAQRVFSYKRHGDLIDEIENTVRENIEKNKYKNIPDRYQSLVITLSPLKGKIKSCREYAFLIRGIQRYKIGDKPEELKIREEKVLEKIEKLLKKLLAKAEKTSPEKLCKNTFTDIMRYCFLAKYSYQKGEILNIKRRVELALFIFALVIGSAIYLSPLFR